MWRRRRHGALCHQWQLLCVVLRVSLQRPSSAWPSFTGNGLGRCGGMECCTEIKAGAGGETVSEFPMKRICDECPWRRDVPVGKFPPERYIVLEDTCRPGGLPAVFACHRSPEGKEKACAGFLIVHGLDNNRCRIAARDGAWKPGEQEAAWALYDNFDQMAKANGYDSKS